MRKFKICYKVWLKLDPNQVYLIQMQRCGHLRESTAINKESIVGVVVYFLCVQCLFWSDFIILSIYFKLYAFSSRFFSITLPGEISNGGLLLIRQPNATINSVPVFSMFLPLA